MPSHKSAEKAVRQTMRRTLINKARMSRIRTFIRKFESTLSSFGKDPSITKEVVNTAFVSAEKELMRGASKGILHKNAAARKVSRLNHKITKVTGS